MAHLHTYILHHYSNVFKYVVIQNKLRQAEEQILVFN